MGKQSDGETPAGATIGDAPKEVRAQGRIGTTLRGKWRLDTLLGVGGMAAVYGATHRNGTRAAVKVLHRELSGDEGIRRRFLREGQIANMVGHDGAVKVLDDDTAEDGSVYLVTELLEGETLEDRCARCGGTLPEDEVLTIADQILDVLAAAHAKELVHRDLKPENVFLTRTGQVKVLDFGIAKARALSSKTHATRAGSTLGTPAFMAPEQARGLWDEVDGRTDVWACGATMFRLLSGRLVHEGRTTNEELLGAMTQPAAPVASVAPSVSPAVARLVDRALAYDRQERWPDATAMQTAIRNAYELLHATAISSAPKPVVPATSVHLTLRSLPDSLEVDSEIGMMATLAAGPVEATTASRSTGGPVSSSVADGPGARRGTRWGVAALGAALVLAAGGAVWFSLGRAPAPAPALSATKIAPPATTTATTAMPTAAMPTAAGAGASSPSAAPAPEASAAESPPAPSARPPPVARPSAGARAAATLPAAGKAGCSPPYVIDPTTGKKNWKLECL